MTVTDTLDRIHIHHNLTAGLTHGYGNFVRTPHHHAFNDGLTAYICFCIHLDKKLLGPAGQVLTPCRLLRGLL